MVKVDVTEDPGKVGWSSTGVPKRLRLGHISLRRNLDGPQNDYFWEFNWPKIGLLYLERQNQRSKLQSSKDRLAI